MRILGINAKKNLRILSLRCIFVRNFRGTEMIFRRKLYDEMLRWKKEAQGKSALLIEGARRVGKSTLAKTFAENEYDSYILIDFSKTSRRINELFEDMMDLDFFFLNLQNIFGITLKNRNSVIIFDEVQFQPLARQAIKHLVADGRYDYIETGSLISIRRNVENILIPSEEHKVTLHPMDFDEFYWATGKNDMPLLLRQAFAAQRPMGEAAHHKLMRDLRLYMLVGGMPQAVDAYITCNDMRRVDDVKREILDLYETDLRKLDPIGNTASRMFRAIPNQLNSNASRFMMNSVAPNQRKEKILSIVNDLEDSKTVVLARCLNDPNVGMGMFHDFDRYKMFLADTGLFITLAFFEKSYTENIIYQKLLSDKLSANLGYVYENLVAQMLCSQGNRLFYYTFPVENSNMNYEIDFLLSRSNKIVPIEVKSSGYKRHKSLDVFCKKFSSRIGGRILLYTKDYAKDGETLCIPVYFTELL